MYDDAMKKILGVPLGLALTVGVSWAAGAMPGAPRTGTPHTSPTVTVTVPGGGGGPSTTQPSGGGNGKPSPFHWGQVFVNPGWCDVQGEHAWTEGLAAYQIPGYHLGGGGLYTYYTQQLFGPGDGGPNNNAQVGYYQWCGDTAPKPPPPLTGDDAIAAARNEGDLASGFTIDPSVRGLTGLEMNLDASTTSAGSVTASNALFSMTATMTPTNFYWKMGDDGEAYGQHTTYVFNGKGTHTITLTVTWRIDYVTTGPGGMTETGSETMQTSTSRDYPVIEARGVLSY